MTRMSLSSWLSISPILSCSSRSWCSAPISRFYLLAGYSETILNFRVANDIPRIDALMRRSRDEAQLTFRSRQFTRAPDAGSYMIDSNR
jgi:hypothetical protein